MKLLLAAAVMLFCVAGSTAAQPMAAVVGSVVDQTSAPLPGVHVTIRGVAVRTADTGAAGDFAFPDLHGWDAASRPGDIWHGSTRPTINTKRRLFHGDGGDGEAATTFALVATLCVCLGFRQVRPYTPFVIPWLYAVMVPLEAHISGTSTNPARTFGPALISGRWNGWWIYWVGPMTGTLAAILVFSSIAKRIEVAKLHHFESDRRLFHRMAGSR